MKEITDVLMEVSETISRSTYPLSGKFRSLTSLMH